MLKELKNVVSLGKGMFKSNIFAAKEMYGFLKANGVEGIMKSEILGETKFNGRDVILIHQEFVFAAMAQTKIPSALCMANKEYAAIFVNDSWRKASKSVKHAIVAHELGHMAEGHLDNPVWSWKNNLSRMIGGQGAIDTEIAADNYADPEALNEFLSLAAEHYNRLGLPIDEINQRMEACNSRWFK